MTKKPSAARVAEISLDVISPNPHNPRRLFDEEPMQILKESINKLGVLVPITVYVDPRRKGRQKTYYILLDGERRWRCCSELEYQNIPAIVVEEPDDMWNILKMFHIHNVREGWQLMPTALKLQTLMKELNETNERSLKVVTQLSISQIRRCKILLTFPKKFQNLMLAPPTTRMKADFFIELERVRRPALADRWEPWIERGDSHCVQIVLDKYQDGIIKAVTEFRLLAEVFRASQRINKEKRFMREFGRFLDVHECPVDEVQIPGATFAKEKKRVRTSAKRLYSQLEDLDLENISADEEIIDLLRDLNKLIKRKLDEALLTRVH